MWERRTTRAALAGAGFVLMFVAGAAAQQAAPAARITTAAEGARRVITPKISEAADRLRQSAPRRAVGRIDWEAVRQLIKATAERDAAAFRARAAGAAAAIRDGRPPAGVEAFDLQKARLRFQTAVEARATRVPLLVPDAKDFGGRLKVFARPDSYAATVKLPDGAEIDILGTRVRVIGGAPETVKARAAARQRLVRRLEGLDAPYVVSRHEEGLDLSFSLFNAAYLVTIRCPAPDTDARCIDETYATGLVRRLALLNEQSGDEQ